MARIVEITWFILELKVIFYKTLSVFTQCITELSVRMGERPQSPPQIFGYRCRPAQQQKGIFLQSFRMAAVRETPGCNHAGKKNRFERFAR